MYGIVLNCSWNGTYYIEDVIGKSVPKPHGGTIMLNTASAMAHIQIHYWNISLDGSW